MYKALDAKSFVGYSLFRDDRPFRNYIVQEISEHFLITVDEAIAENDFRVHTSQVDIKHSLDEALTSAHEVLLGQIGFLNDFQDRTSKAKPKKKS